MALSAAERETVIVISDADDFWTIHTCQRRMVTQLLKNPVAKILENTLFEGTRFLVAEVPANGITVRKSNGRKAKSSQPRKATLRTMPGEKCGGTKSDGSKCGAIAVSGTGFCRHHQSK